MNDILCMYCLHPKSNPDTHTPDCVIVNSTVVKQRWVVEVRE